MKEIIVDVNSLKAKLLEAEKDGMGFVELCLVPSQVDNEQVSPAFLHVEGISKNGLRTDYESIDEASVLEHRLIGKSA